MSIWPEPRNLHQKVGIEKDMGGKATPYVGINDVILSIKAVVQGMKSVYDHWHFIS